MSKTYTVLGPGPGPGLGPGPRSCLKVLGPCFPVCQFMLRDEQEFATVKVVRSVLNYDHANYELSTKFVEQAWRTVGYELSRRNTSYAKICFAIERSCDRLL